MADKTVIGLTGGIACGKSTVSRLLTRRGARVIDADHVSRLVVAPGSEGLEQVVDAFGAEILDEGGALDRAALGQRVFGDDDARATLEGILHPRIAAESMRLIGEALASEAPLVVYDAALLVESGRAEMFRPLVVVTASPETQRARIVARDGLPADEAQARIDAQMPVAEKAALADHVIDNDGDLQRTEAQVEALWLTLTSRGAAHVP